MAGAFSVGFDQSSLPGLTRQSISFAKPLAKKMDPRVKPARDACGGAMLNNAIRICSGEERQS